jgi:ssDNA-binding Zn-finger/Zn-ribbon topoisomerase 1
MLENAGLNCPKCKAWMLYKGHETACSKCGWKISPEIVAVIEKQKED